MTERVESLLMYHSAVMTCQMPPRTAVHSYRRGFTKMLTIEWITTIYGAEVGELSWQRALDCLNTQWLKEERSRYRACGIREWKSLTDDNTHHHRSETEFRFAPERKPEYSM